MLTFGLDKIYHTEMFNLTLRNKSFFHFNNTYIKSATYLIKNAIFLVPKSMYIKECIIPGDLKSGIPLGTLRPAPAMTMIFEARLFEMLSAISSTFVQTLRN